MSFQAPASSANRINFIRGNKYYELSNHLGNVLSTVSDKKIAVDDGIYHTLGVKLNNTPDAKIDYYTADVVTANDYYPFGMLQPGRKYSSQSGYRYGFNGKENDKDVKGDGNQQDYGMRIYDPRLGKFLSVDPISPKYPELTPYQFASNTPMEAVDMDGKEAFFINLQAECQGIFVGAEAIGGIAFDSKGMAFYGSVGGKTGIGLSATLTVNVGMYPEMDDIKNMKGIGGATNYSGGLVLDGGVSYLKSGDYSGVSYGAGLGAGAQITESVNHTWMSDKIEWSDFTKMFPTRPGKDETNPFPFPVSGFLTNATNTGTVNDAAKSLLRAAKPVLFEHIDKRKNEIDAKIQLNNNSISSAKTKSQEFDKKKKPTEVEKILNYINLLGIKEKEKENENLKKEKENLENIKTKVESAIKN